MPLILQDCAVESGKVVATYLASLADGDAALSAPIRMESSDEGAVASVVNLDQTMAETEDEAFEALASKLEAVAKALRARGEPKLAIPVYR